jgi:regulatory protein
VPEEDSPLARAKAVALRYLASRARTEAQVRARLDRDDLGAQADEAVRWLVHLGYLDDAAWARARARSLVAPGRLGPRLAERRLEAAGIERERAREAVSAAVDEAASDLPAGGGRAEAALCRALASRRAGAAGLDALDDRGRARLSRFLLGRGFSGETVALVVGTWQDG